MYQPQSQLLVEAVKYWRFTSFLVTALISPVGVELERKAIEQGFLIVKESEGTYQKPPKMEENESKAVMEDFKNPQNWGKMNQKPPKMGENDEETPNDKQKPPFPTMLYKNVYDAICLNPKIKYQLP